MQGHGCCFCWAGDDAQTWISLTGPFGEYSLANNIINCSSQDDHSPTRQCGGPAHVQNGPGAQQFGVMRIPTAGNTTAYLYTGVRFGSAPDGNKCHEFQYWAPLEFDASGRVFP